MQGKSVLYDSFNARYLSFQQVASSFIPNTEFSQVISNSSMLLMGPRGCGKTTLLKMLTPAGIHYWKQATGQDSLAAIQFTAIYIPSDIQWKNQLDYLNEQLNAEPEFNELIAQFLFATNVQIAICKTFSAIIDFSGWDSAKKLLLQDEVCRGLIDVWQIDKPAIPTFDELEIKLLMRVAEVNGIVNEIIYKKPGGNLATMLPKYAFSEFFDLVQLGCKIFEQKLKWNPQNKWALCFDELEIAPKLLQIKLMKYLRSVDQKYLFKLTTTPLFNLNNNLVEATQGNDFNTVKLWVYDESGKAKWRDFCYNLIGSRLQKKYINPGMIPPDVFGRFRIDEVIKDELSELSEERQKSLGYHGSFLTGVGKKSSVNFLFKYLASIDESFRKFLINRSIDPNDPYAKTYLEGQRIFRKYKADAAIRMIYYKRTRRSPSIHWGVPYIFDICDGNPRLVIGLVDEILLRSKFTLTNSKISKSEQSQVILDASKKYYNQLQNHPDSTILINGVEVNLANDLLYKIGNYMHNKIVQEDYSITSPSTFIVDTETNSNLITLLETALYLGAIVYLDPIESLSNTGIIGKRFRLSSFLTPYFKIPDRVLSQVNLSSLLKVEMGSSQTKIDF